MQRACLFATAVFGLFAVLQLNDREQYGTEGWYAWFLAYAAVAVISLGSWRRPLPRAFYLAATVVTLVAVGLRARAIEWGSSLFYNESNPAANESAGLLIVAVWLAVLAWKRVPD
ncbi:MAG: transmembrane 220 family protein [Acidobacteriota bacterium]